MCITDQKNIFNSFLSAGGEKEQQQVLGFFDDNILNHTVGNVMIFEAVRDYIKENQPINQVYISGTIDDL